MALKVLMLRKRLENSRANLAALIEKDAEFDRREAELEAAIEEAQTAEEQTTVEESVEDFTEDKKNHEAAKGELQDEIASIERELEAAEEQQRSVTPPQQQEPEQHRAEEHEVMNTRKFFGMNMEERTAFFAREDVKDFLARTRELGAQKRTITGAELLIPEIVLGLIRENVANYSKLIGHVNLVHVNGTARETIIGDIPEAIWTEMCANLNEVALTFYGAEVDGYKVAAYIPVCNAILEDADINLAATVIDALARGIGIALDKAILYGTGVKMPTGIVTRLAQTTAPSGAPATARPWENLSATNMVAITGKTDLALFKEIVTAFGAAKNKYSATGGKFFVMNEKTHNKLVVAAMSINAAGAIVTGINNVMPVIGGDIIDLSFVPDDVIIGGYGDCYLLAERAGMNLAQSEHARFVEDQTVFKATARYDGAPIIAEAFVAIGIGGAKPSASAVTFTADTANTASGGEG